MAHTTPKLGDSDNDLLHKIATSLDGSGGSGAVATAVAGSVADNAPETQKPIPVAGIAVTSATYAPAYADGDRASLAVDKATGGLLAHIRQLTAATDFVSASGDIAHDAVDSGNPMKVGGKAIGSESGPTAVGFNDRVNAWFDTIGRQVVKVGGKDLIAVLSSAARTADATSATQTHSYAKGLSIWFKVTAISGSPSLTLRVEGQNPVDGSFTTFETFTAVTGISNNFYQIYPGIATAAGFVSKTIPRGYRIVVAHGTADSVTYSVGTETEI